MYKQGPLVDHSLPEISLHRETRVRTNPFFTHDNTICSLQSHAGAVLSNRAALTEEWLTPFLFIVEGTWLVPGVC